jgi:hypothetical protein
MNEESVRVLTAAGLTKWEARTYLALLRSGPSTTGPIATAADVPHSKIYGVLGNLAKKGLVSFVIYGKRKRFEAAKPDRLLLDLEERQRDLTKMLPHLNAVRSETKSASLFVGLKALRALFTGLVQKCRKGEHFLGFSSGTAYTPEAAAFYDWWGHRKKLLHLKDLLLVSHSHKREFEQTIRPESLSAVLAKTRYSKIVFPGDVAIFRDCVVLLSWEDEPTAICIADRAIAEQYRLFFMHAWKSSANSKLTEADIDSAGRQIKRSIAKKH